MPDVTKCKGEGCKLVEFCWRFTCIPSQHYQSYFTESPVNKDGTCDEYWENKCPYCGQFDGIHKLSCATGKKTVYL